MAYKTSVRRFAVVALAAWGLSLGTARNAAAQGFISPFIGYNFSGDSGCQELLDCDDKRIDWGVAVGALGNLFGFEADFGYTPDFFGKTSVQKSNVFTVMGNVLLVPQFGAVHPYGLVGIGLIRTSVEATATTASSENSQWGWDVGGGVFVLFSRHVGVRGDVRYFHAFEILDLSNFPNIPRRDEKLDYGRFSGAVVFTF